MDRKLKRQIDRYAETGDELLAEEMYENAIVQFNNALELIPEPKMLYEESTWVYAALGDCYFFINDFKTSLNSFYDAYKCPNGVDNPYINLRLGQNLFEEKQLDKSQEYLLRAYMLGGKEIFEDEEEKYFKSIKTII